MTEWIWLNGEILPMADARLGIEDRGFQFADGVYEVIRLYNGKPFAHRQDYAGDRTESEEIGGRSSISLAGRRSPPGRRPVAGRWEWWR